MKPVKTHKKSGKPGVSPTEERKAPLESSRDIVVRVERVPDDVLAMTQDVATGEHPTLGKFQVLSAWPAATALFFWFDSKEKYSVDLRAILEPLIEKLQKDGHAKPWRRRDPA